MPVVGRNKSSVEDTGWEATLNHKDHVLADTTWAKLSELAFNTIYQHALPSTSCTKGLQ